MMGTASIRLICFYDGDLINENKNADYVGGKKKLSKVSKTIGFKEFKEKIQAMLGLQPDDSEFTIKCRVYLDKEIQIAIDVDDDESLSSIMDQSEFLMAYIIKQQPSVINTHQRETHGSPNVEKETIGGGGVVDPPNEMNHCGHFVQTMEQPLPPSNTDASLHAFRHALSDLAIRKKTECKPFKTTKSRLTLKCKSVGCKSKIRRYESMGNDFVKCECVFPTSYECTHDKKLSLKRKLPKLNPLGSTLMIEPSELVADKEGPKKKKLSKHENSTKMDQSSHEFTKTQDELKGQQSVFKPKQNELFMKQIPSWIQDYVDSIEDVLADGNCGFRCIANFLNYDKENGWKQVRNELLVELETNKKLWVGMWHEHGVMTVKNALIVPEGNVCIDQRNWLLEPDMLELAANRYRCVFVCYGNQSTTCFPYDHQASQLNCIRICFMAHLAQSAHFVLLHMTFNPPLPLTVPTWPSRLFPKAISLKSLFDDQLHIGDVMVRKFNDAKKTKNSKEVIDILD